MARGRAQTDSAASKQANNVNSKKRPNEEPPQTLSKKLKAKQQGKTAPKKGEESFTIAQFDLNIQKVMLFWIIL